MEGALTTRTTFVQCLCMRCFKMFLNNHRLLWFDTKIAHIERPIEKKLCAKHITKKNLQCFDHNRVKWFPMIHNQRNKMTLKMPTINQSYIIEMTKCGTAQANQRERGGISQGKAKNAKCHRALHKATPKVQYQVHTNVAKAVCMCKCLFAMESGESGRWEDVAE